MLDVLSTQFWRFVTSSGLGLSWARTLMFRLISASVRVRRHRWGITGARSLQQRLEGARWPHRNYKERLQFSWVWSSSQGFYHGVHFLRRALAPPHDRLHLVDSRAMIAHPAWVAGVAHVSEETAGRCEKLGESRWEQKTGDNLDENPRLCYRLSSRNFAKIKQGQQDQASSYFFVFAQCLLHLHSCPPLLCLVGPRLWADVVPRYAIW